MPTGLTADGLYVLQSAMKYGVQIAGVNLMTMDYGESAAPNPQGQMGNYAIEAADSLFGQLRHPVRHVEDQRPAVADDRHHADDRR